jgi:adenylate cyclase
VAKVFLSYAREDAPIAKGIAECIGAAGHDVWWDRHIQGGSRFASEIDRELKGADAVVVLWTEASIDSAWVQDEAAEGRDSGRLVPVTFGGSRPPLGFRQFHTVDLGAWDGSGEPLETDDLLDAIAKIAGSSQPTAGVAAVPSQPAPRGPSVCVLPFVNMSGDPEQEYFSDGITEDIITDLSKVSALMVIARNTSFTFKGKVMDVKEVAQALDVSHVLEGSVRKAGSRVRITAQLIDGKTGGHVWADRYDRDLTDIFAIQDEISKAIVAALRIKLLPEEKKAIEARGTANVEAYNLYLMARQQWVSGTFGDFRRDEAIVRICRQATIIDPGYAQAWALMALAQAELRFWYGKQEDAMPAAQRALSLDPNLAEARCVTARYFEESGEQAKANAEITEALKLDSESWEVNREAARMMFREGRVREAIPFFEKAASLMDTDWHNPSMLMSCYNSLNDKENLHRVARLTLDRVQNALSHEPTNGAAIAVGASALAMFGEKDRAREWVQRGLLLDPDNLSMRYNLACAMVMELDDPEGALDALQPYFDLVMSPIHVKHLEADPDMDSLRNHPRFKEMLERTRRRLKIPEATA